MKIHRAEIIGTFITVTGSTTNLTGSFRGSFEGDEKLATTGSNTFNGNQTVNGDMTVTGRIVAEEFHTELISSSIIYKSGSTKFGDSLDDNHGFTGSLSISGSLNINGTSYSAATSGTSGVNGSSGDTGSSGSAGTSGTSGADGSSGATGSSGSAGTSGSSGLSVGNAYLHTQSSSSSTWTITHNLNYKYLSVTVYDSSDNIMLPESIVANSENQLTISFGVNESGYAMLSYGASSSGTSGASGATGTSGSSGSSGSSGTSAGSASRNVTTFIATSGQTTFTISSGYTVGLVDVFVNGVRYSPTDFTATNGTTVVLGVSSDVDDVVDIIHYVSSMTAIAGEGTTGTIPKYTASGTIGNSIITDNGTNATVNGSLTVTGNLTAQQFIVSSSFTHLTTSFSSGSTKFGDSSDDNHNFTGSILMTGSLTVVTTGTELQVNANGVNIGNTLTDSHIISGSVRINPNGLFVSSSGVMGVGTTTPWGRFNVVVGANKSLVIQDAGIADTMEITNYASSGGLQNILLTSAVLSFGTGTAGGGNATERMRITAAGNVGIGTTSPNNILSIEKSSNSGSASGFPTILLKNTLATQGDGSSTFNFSNLLVSAGNGAVDMYFGTTYAAGTWAPAGIINLATNHDLQIKTNNTERMRITSGGNVGIGTSSPFSNLHVRGSNTNEGTIAIGNESYPCVLFSSAATGEFRIDNRASSAAGYISFYPNGQQNSVGNERMRITHSGPVLIGTTTAFSSGLLCLQGSSAVYNILSIKDTYTGPFNDVWYLFLTNDSGSRAGGIQHTASTTVSFVTSSDYRLKEDFKQIKGLETLLKIKTYDFKFKEEEFRMDGVIAHELAEVLPYAVSGVKDGKEMQGVDYSKLVPVLIKSVQELSAELTSAKQEIELLKLK
jgi:hypothetical protein